MSKPRAIALLIVCVAAALNLWFSATAVVPALIATYGLSDSHAGALTSAVQIGFVAGTLASAFLGLADRLDPRRFFAASAATGAAANALVVVLDPAGGALLACRFVTGAAIAGIYPVGMKMATTWAVSGGARADMGLLVGLLVGALTLGSGTPHLFNAFAVVEWRIAIGAASLTALGAAALVLRVPLGPNRTASPPFDWSAALTGYRQRALRLANLGYLGHMWELYAMWAWIGVFLIASFEAAGIERAQAAFWAPITTFAVVGVAGAMGCALAGVLADRVGRTTVTIAAMAISGTCCVVAGALFGTSPWLLVPVCLVWGASIVADSAQFSAAIAELAPPDRIGTVLTMQTALGFLLTLLTIQLMPFAVDALGWRFAFVVLAMGPLFGIVAMARLRNRPEARLLANGRR